MPPASDLILLTAPPITFALVIALRRWRIVQVLALIIAIVGSWLMMMSYMNAEVEEMRRQQEAREDRGEVLTMEEALSDGTGENASALLCGWLPGVIGALVGFSVDFAIGRRAARRTGEGDAGTALHRKPLATID
jgi:nitrate/nitrite transporter NarK